MRPLLFTLLLVSAGCGGPTPTPGGTRGKIHCGGAALSDIQVTVHRADSGYFDAVGFGISGADGEFELRDNLADGPLWLTPGKYRFTVESTGPDPMLWPANYRDAAQTPLRRTWAVSDSALDIEMPEPSTR